MKRASVVLGGGAGRAWPRAWGALMSCLSKGESLAGMLAQPVRTEEKSDYRLPLSLTVTFLVPCSPPAWRDPELEAVDCSPLSSPAELSDRARIRTRNGATEADVSVLPWRSIGHHGLLLHSSSRSN